MLFIAAFVFVFVGLSLAEVVPYTGVMGGIATLSADAGSGRVGQGLNLSSYAPANGGALDVFVGSHLYNYVSVQGDFIWNKNGLRLNSSSSGTGSFYEQDRGSTQRAAIFSFSHLFSSTEQPNPAVFGHGCWCCTFV